ncbi:BolA family transcriptional regulator [bacterium]|jgi:BolA family transcriptional regulator, general stress-responsive regulator|nr:BolA family transcriptional regulator [bacterium]
MITVKELDQQLTIDFNPETLSVEDDSHLHSGHYDGDGGVSHVTIKIQSEKFSGKTKVQIHRLIYQSLDPFIKRGLHAIKIVLIK